MNELGGIYREMMGMMRGSRRGKGIAFLLVLMMACVTVLPLETQYASAAETKLTTPTLKSVVHEGTTLKVTWKKNTSVTGYQVQYATNRVFMHRLGIRIKSNTAKYAEIQDVSMVSTYYVRLRSYYKDETGTTTYSDWAYSPNVRTNKTVSKKVLRKGLTKFELRKAAGQSMYGYDTMQGACYANGYAYCLLYDRTRSTYNCKIAKVQMSSMNVVKVSAPLTLHHGNDLTFNTRENRLIVAHSTGATKTVSVINPSTLQIIKNVNVELPAKKLEGLTAEKLRKYRAGTYNGFGAIAYNKKHNQYVVVLRGETFHHLMFLNSNFKPVRFEYVSPMLNQTAQGMDSFGDYILAGQCFSSGKPYNNILVYDWEGRYLSQLVLGDIRKNGEYEFENVFHSGKDFYVGYYRSHYKYKIGKGNVLRRSNYLYKMTGF